MSGVLGQSIDDLRTNARQWEAFSTKGHCVVIAPPGSGKTKLLTTKMAVDLEQHIALPHGVAAVTFTVAAASELRDRLRKLGSQNRGTNFIGTVHGFALSCIVLPFAHAAGRPELTTLQLATKPQQDAILGASINKYFRPGSAEHITQTVERLRSHLASQEEWVLLGDGYYNAVQDYRSGLRDQGLIDFQGIVEEAVYIVQNFPMLRKVLQARFPRIYVDEYQDLPPALDKLVRLLCFEGENPSTLFAVGDPDQAIFSFLWTKPNLLEQLANVGDVQQVTLDRNYRSGEHIVEKAALVKNSHYSTVSDRTGGTILVRHCAGGYEEQLSEIAQSIVRAKDKGVRLEEIAVICPQNNQCQTVARVLIEHGVASRSSTNLYRQTGSTSLLEESATWCFLGQESSGIHLSSLLTRFKQLNRGDFNIEAETQFVATLRSIDPQGSSRASDFIATVMSSGLGALIEDIGADEEKNEVEAMLNAYTKGFGGNDVHQLAARGLKTGRVEVMTIHASKGREFDHVFIPGMDQESIPSYHATQDPSQLPEERRKFYVSFTRARETVLLLYSGYVVTPWGKRKPTGPSVFLYELGLLTK